MKLYYSAGSCSTSCHITLEESGLKYEAIEVDFDKPTDQNTVLISKLNPLGTLPILITDDGKQLDQNLAIHTYIADLVPQKELLPQENAFERASAMNWMSFVCSDLHKSIGALFSVTSFSEDKIIQEVIRKHLTQKAGEYLSFMDSQLKNKDYLTGSHFTAVDAYAFVVTGWTKWLEIPLTPYKNIEGYMARIANRPSVAKVLKEEGLT